MDSSPATKDPQSQPHQLTLNQAADSLSSMQILLNGEALEVPENCTAAQLVEILELGDKRIAMEVNLEIVPRSIYTDVTLHPGDRVEIVHAIGGG
jgi:sulfur carrier protein